MPIIDYKAVVKTLEGEVGKQFEHYASEYSRFLDNITNSNGSRGWYNYPKTGVCTWCCILADYAVAVNKGNLTYEQARLICCEPANHNYNAGAGVKESAGYFKSAGRWINNAKNATTGDRIFLNGLNHVGTVVGWDSTGLFYIDGSTTYNGKPYSVGKKHISFNAGNIDGFGRPDWYKFADSDPKPTPTPTPTEKKYRVTGIKTFLAIRSTPEAKSDDSNKVGELYNGAVLTVKEIKGNWANISGDCWVSTNYLKQI